MIISFEWLISCFFFEELKLPLKCVLRNRKKGNNICTKSGLGLSAVLGQVDFFATCGDGGALIY